MRLSSLSVFSALFFVHSDCSVDTHETLSDGIVELTPEDLNVFAEFKDMSLFRHVAWLPLNREHSLQYISNENGFQDEANRRLDNPRKQIRLNLGEGFRRYMINAEFRAKVDALVENPLKQVWSDVERLDLSFAPVDDISPLVGLKNLETLWLSDTQVTSISPLAGLENLMELYVSPSQVPEFMSLARLENLTNLFVGVYYD